MDTQSSERTLVGLHQNGVKEILFSARVVVETTSEDSKFFGDFLE